MKHDLETRKKALDYYLVLRRTKNIGCSIAEIAKILNVGERTLWAWKDKDEWDRKLSEQVEVEYKSRHILYEDFEVALLGLTLAINILGKSIKKGEDKIRLGNIIILLGDLVKKMVSDTYTYPKNYRVSIDRFLDTGFSKEELKELDLISKPPKNKTGPKTSKKRS